MSQSECVFSIRIYAHTIDFGGSTFLGGGGGSPGVPLVLELELCRMVRNDVLFATFKLPALMSSVFYRP
jgi:hypothetical protein